MCKLLSTNVFRTKNVMSYALILIITDILESLTLKDPCEKCLVKAACRKNCPEKEEFQMFIFPHETAKQKKYWAWGLILSILFSFISIGGLTYKMFF